MLPATGAKQNRIALFFLDSPVSSSSLYLTCLPEQPVHRPQRREHGCLALGVGGLSAGLGTPGLAPLEVCRELDSGVEN